ncbi:hypothetical protein BF49_1079 [Bradyrhizobium sp.]|nr:hypothetical protein BF49_1079 [Bradyrhizobium sp.]
MLHGGHVPTPSAALPQTAMDERRPRRTLRQRRRIGAHRWG